MYVAIVIALLIFIMLSMCRIWEPLELPPDELQCWWTPNDDNNCKLKHKKVCEKYGGVFYHRLGYPWCYSASKTV